jgi:type IV secretion system protein VirD4
MSAARRKGKILAGVAALVLAGLSAGTQQVAHEFHYPREFGSGLFDIGHHRIYAPWKLVPWSIDYGTRLKKPFDAAQLTAFGIITLPMLIGVGIMRRRRRQVREFGAEAWGTVDDAARAGLVDRQQRPTGRVLGMMNGKRLTYHGPEHSLVVGASRSGKGVGYVIPTVAAWEQSIFVYDRKGEIWHITADHRKQFSHTFYFAPTDPNTARWNPLFEVRKGPMEIADIQNIVTIIVDPLGSKAGDLNFWDQSASNFFVGVILHVLYSAPDDKKNLTHVRELLLDIEPTIDAMLYTKHRHRPDPFDPQGEGLARDEDGKPIAETHPEVRLGATAFRNMDEKVRSSVLATAQAALTLFADPLVSYATSWSDYAIGDLVCSPQPVSFYLITPQAHADRLAFLVRIMLRQTINSLMEHIDMDSRGRRKQHRMLLMLDEFPKLGALPFLENALGEMAGYGITTQLICQSFNDVFGKYGLHTSIFDNMHITSAFATSEPNSIEKIIKRAGKALEFRESYSDPRTIWHQGRRTTSVSEQERYILAEQDVRALDNGKQFIFVNNAKPLVADKIRYFEDPFFKRVTTDFFHGQHARHKQTPKTLDRPGIPKIDWIGVEAVELYQAAPPAPTTAPEERGDGEPVTMGAPSTAEAAAVPAELAASDFFDPIDSDDED